MARWTIVYYLICCYYCPLATVLAFNLDIHAPIYKIGPNGSYFGFAVAEHFKANLPVEMLEEEDERSKMLINEVSHAFPRAKIKQ
ncbi:unnamed protein product [Onchocerca flexuosa]|uniref:Secreted protein n=1 Tax=Onchocerca flexuosa TaxID=387005 RepID=A0A183HRC4_9BILA|nr:unnamed protein product [Onchocerca flexuosa]